ncbi:endonuclease domain-containing protein [Blastococcus sp. SYSU D01042]
MAHEDYVRNASTASGFGSRCRPCDRAANSAGYFYRKYKLTRSELMELRQAQENRCGICGEPDPQHLDHDHSTGRIRMLLCQRCNQGLGLFRDDPYLLHVAGLYVEGHRQQQASDTLVAASVEAAEAPSRPGEPPVGSQRRPAAPGTSTRSTGRTDAGTPA